MRTKHLERLQAVVGLSVVLVCWAAAARIDAQPAMDHRVERMSEFDAAFIAANADRGVRSEQLVFAAL